MQARVDIVSPVTGRILLSSSLDAPSDGLSRKENWKVVRTLRRAQKQLEKEFGEGHVRLTLDSYEGTVFWFLVLLRPITFDARHPELGNGSWSIYELLRKKSTAKYLDMTDLGLVVDRENMWLAMDWREARRGIMQDFEECPSWDAILRKQQRRLDRAGIAEKVGDVYWKQCARSFSHTVSAWQLEKMSYLKEKMWHFGKVTHDDLIVLDLAGVDIPQLDISVTENIEFPVAKRASFAHFYTDDPREYRAVQRMATREKRQADPQASMRDVRRKVIQRERRKMRTELGGKQAWYDASRLIAKLPRLLGKGMKGGGYQKFLSGKRSDELYSAMVDAYMNGELVDINRRDLEIQLGALENLLEDETVPKEFTKWLNWKNKMEGVRKEVESR